MKNILIAAMLLGPLTPAIASPSDPTGFSDLIIAKVKDAQAGGSVRFSDGHMGALTYLPIKTFHTGSLNWLMLNAGVEAMKNEALRGIAFVSTDIVGLTNRLFFTSNWADAHVTGSQFPPIQVGVGPALPLDYPTLQHYSLKQLGQSCRLTAAVRFGDVVK